MIRWLVVPALALTCSAAWPQAGQQPAPQFSQLTDIPACSALAGARPAPVEDQPARFYVGQPMKEIKRAVPGLRGLEEQTAQGVPAGENATAALPLDSILQKTGSVVSTMLHQLPNLLAREVVQPVDESEQMVSALPDRAGSLGRRGNSMTVPMSQSEPKESVFNYRIVGRTDPVFGVSVDESRTDSHQRPVTGNFPHSVGFGFSWLIFLPDQLQRSDFRLLGTQRVNKRQTYVVAFAQKPDRSRLDTLVDSTAGRCYGFTQGVVWIDSSDFDIVRLETDLLQPLPVVGLDELHSTIEYGKANIPEHSEPFWLPRRVDVRWKVGNDSGEERHSYSNYHLFEATTTIHYDSDPDK